MTPVIRKHLQSALWLMAVCAFAVGMLFMFKAGCAGDLKGGSLGNRELALNHEGTGSLFTWLSLLVGLFAIGTNARLVPSQRLALLFGFFVVGAIAAIILGIQFEVWGVQACF